MDAVVVRRSGRGYVLEHETELDCTLDRVAAFFDRPENLEAITPGFLRFRVLTPSPVPMHDGARVEYVVRLLGVPMRWRSRIEGYEPGRAFTDVAERSPYAYWIHRHELERRGGRTLVKDRVEYAPPLGVLGRLAHALFVRSTLVRIFRFRGERMRALLERA